MGQANKRGTFEERLANAIEHKQKFEALIRHESTHESLKEAHRKMGTDALMHKMQSRGMIPYH